MILRFVIASAAGLAVGLIATVVAWQTIGPMLNVRYSQWFTQRTLDELAQAIPAYQERMGALPGTLDDLRALDKEYYLPFDDEQGLLDGWNRPLEYTTDGTNYTVTSFGRDGQSGGVGLNCDLTHSKPRPAASLPTFTQFVFDCPTEGIVGTCVVSGLLACVLSWILAKPTQLTRRRLLAVGFKIVATVVGAIIVGFFLAMFHIPTGH